jgi:DNA-binding CsgD family transcriptional regulator
MSRRFAHDTVDREARKARMAQLVSNGASLAEAGMMMGITVGQASRLWQNIKAELGWQAT